MFRETIGFVIEDCIPEGGSFEENLKKLANENRAFAGDDGSLVSDVISEAVAAIEAGGGRGEDQNLDSEVVHEQGKGLGYVICSI